MIEAIREWAARHTADRRYSPVGVAFHWIMAALISFQLYWGWYMSRMPVGGDKLDAYKLHSELGLGMLVLATLRFVWRTIVPGPINDADGLGWQTKLAYVTHALFTSASSACRCLAGRCGRRWATGRSSTCSAPRGRNCRSTIFRWRRNGPSWVGQTASTLC